MRNHVFAVWDFMSLLKRLQQEIADCKVPWLPRSASLLTGFVNRIVMAEESDDDGRGGFASHFDLYREAMQDVGAEQGPIDFFLERLRTGENVRQALAATEILETTRSFVEQTIDLAQQGSTHQVAAAFCYGREDVIPGMFARIVESLQAEGYQMNRLRLYLNRHIDLDSTEHGPLARRLVEHFCGKSERCWDEAAETARASLEARIRLWDGILNAIGSAGPLPRRQPGQGDAGASAFAEFAT